MPPKLPPADPCPVAAFACAVTEATVISPSKIEMLAASLEAVARAVRPTVVAVAAWFAPVRIAEPSLG